MNRLSFSLQAKNEFPYPSSNPLYNIFDSDLSSHGFVLPLGFCLVGVLTCTENAHAHSQGISRGKGGIFRNALDAIGGGRFRVPLPSAVTRMSAFRHSFEVFGITLGDDAKKVFPNLTAAATWASGRLFLSVARKLQTDMKNSGSAVASGEVLRKAMVLERDQTTHTVETVSYSTDFPCLGTSASSSKAVTFASVGGNAEAKLALEDALALDPEKRQLLSSFGLHAPTGVLLYGAPGCGKTLLAKAVAQSLSAKGVTNLTKIGGAFISLKASEIVRPEVGNSEKMIVSAFETARLNAPSVIFIDEFQVSHNIFSVCICIFTS